MPSALPRPVYLDCCATTPVEEEVIEVMTHYLRYEYGNAGSRTHVFGTAAAQAVRRAREQVAAVVDASWEEILFTSGATESNNLALLGAVAKFGNQSKKHIISSTIEHPAVLEPLKQLSSQGHEVTLLPATPGGVVDTSALAEALRPDTCLVSVMHVNNETGVIQPLAEIAEILGDHPALFHTDASQGFGKDLGLLRLPRLNLISVSGHKIFGPKGVGALIVRDVANAPRLSPMIFGGGQERGLRPGTVAVPLVAGLGLAAEIAVRDLEYRQERCLRFRQQLLSELGQLGLSIVGDPSRRLPHVLSLRFDRIDADALIIALRDQVSISTGSACSSSKFETSHVLSAMGLSSEESHATTRWSWCHHTNEPDWSVIRNRVNALR